MRMVKPQRTTCMRVAASYSTFGAPCKPSSSSPSTTLNRAWPLFCASAYRTSPHMFSAVRPHARLWQCVLHSCFCCCVRAGWPFCKFHCNAMQPGSNAAGWFSSASQWRAAKHIVTRARLNVALLDQLDLVNRTAELAKTFGIDWYSVVSRGSQYRVEAMLARLAHTQNYLLVCHPLLSLLSSSATTPLESPFQQPSGWAHLDWDTVIHQPML